MNTVKVLNPLKQLQKFGQSIWFDYVRRNLLTSGELNRLIKDDGLRGMTSNPSIFEKAIAGSTDYDEAIEKLSEQDLDAAGLYEKLAIEDIQKRQISCARFTRKLMAKTAMSAWRFHPIWPTTLRLRLLMQEGSGDWCIVRTS